MVKIQIDGAFYEVNAEKNLLENCLHWVLTYHISVIIRLLDL